MSFKRCDWKIVTLVTDPGGVKLYGAYLAQYGHGLQFWESPSESTVSTKIPRVCRRIWVLKSWRYALPSFQALRLSIGACQRWVQECIVGSGDSSGGTYFMEHTHVQNIGSTYCTVEAVREGSGTRFLIRSIYSGSTDRLWWLMGKKLLMPVNTPLTALRIVGGVINKDLVP